jgi:hypothetical protein
MNLNEAKNIILIMMILTAADIISYINTIQKKIKG